MHACTQKTTNTHYMQIGTFVARAAERAWLLMEHWLKVAINLLREKTHREPE